jgi:hypothetical protein
MTEERMEVRRLMPAEPDAIFAVLTDPQGHVAIDSSGMLMAASGEPVRAVGDTFLIHMDREALNDRPLGLYDVTVTITRLVPDREIAWQVRSTLRPPIGHVWGYLLDPVDGATMVTAYYDWSEIDPADKALFPVVPESALRATLGILDRTTRRAHPG